MFIISVLIFSSLLYCSYPEIKVRRTTSSYRKNYEWELEGDRKRHKFPLWVTLVAILICLIPVVNVILAFVAIIYYIKQLTPEFFLSESPEDHLMDALEFFGVKHKYIVYAQAILETGHFNSNICKEYNNLFGLYNSYKKDYYRFKHWTESVEAYLKYIQYRYKPPNNYYKFLDSIGYAEDPEYTAKVKKIVNRIENGKI